MFPTTFVFRHLLPELWCCLYPPGDPTSTLALRSVSMLVPGRWQLEGPGPSSALPMGTGGPQVLGGTDTHGVSTLGPGLCLVTGAKATRVQPDVEPLVSQVLSPMDVTQGDVRATAAGRPCSHQLTPPKHPCFSFWRPIFLLIEINPSADISRTALQVALQKNSGLEIHLWGWDGT